MKPALPSLLIAVLFLVFPDSVRSQEEETPDPTLQKPHQLAVLTGIGSQWFDLRLRFASLSVERPVGLYKHAGLEFISFFPDFNNYYSNGPNLLRNSYEIGGYLKFFLHGRLTGRKSSIYFGPELKIGARRYEEIVYSNLPFFIYRERTIKFLVRWGAQFKFGHALLELNLPFGIESFKKEHTTFRNTKVVLLPGLQMGYAF